MEHSFNVGKCEKKTFCVTRLILHSKKSISGAGETSGHTASSDTSMQSRDGNTNWSTIPPSQSRRGSENIVRNQTGITADGRVDSIDQAFGLFITEEMISTIVKYTNEEAA